MNREWMRLGMRERLSARFAQSILVRVLDAYREIGDDEPRRTVEFLESQPGRELTGQLNQALVRAMYQAAQNAVNQLPAKAE